MTTTLNVSAPSSATLPILRRRNPLSTYRLQMHAHFGFMDAKAVVHYIRRLGVADCYTSPLFKARPGSTHGYDITDHNVLNPELGSEQDYAAFCLTLKESGLGHLMDFVPNHMGIDSESNPWWNDVLENGPASPFAHYFDIDWNPIKPELRNKVLLPILGDQYGVVLERGELQLIFEDGALALHYGGERLPINPRLTPDVLKQNLSEFEKDIKDTAEWREFLSIMTELSNLPAIVEMDPERIDERQREKAVARDRLVRLVSESSRIRRHVEECVKAINGRPGDPASFDALHRLLEAQAYRLAYWKTASHEINYRRFFDINQLAGLRVEQPEVFAATHQRLLDLLGTGQVTGVRLDHPDGLYDPAAYFESLQAAYFKILAGQASLDPSTERPDEWRKPLYLAAEKILSAGEILRKSWAIDGTTGYDFLNSVSHLFVDSQHGTKLKDIYERFTGRPADLHEEIYRCKKLIMSTSLSSELNVLAHLLNDISETNRRWRDFTLDSLRDALREVVACFPVYRTYINGSEPSPSDELVITKAVAEAKRLNPALEATIFDFVRDMLIPRPSPDLPESEFRRRLHFAMKFQQYTAPVQAKGVEDTAFYRYAVLLSVNEVGGDPDRMGTSIADFHQSNVDRQRDWPTSLLATATHDTKRGEDTRARLHVLSELPEDWEQVVFQWSELNRAHKTVVEGRSFPDRNDEYLVYQTLLGAWVPGTSLAEDSTLVPRMHDYLIKALREAKRFTSWIRPNDVYEKAVQDFVDKVLSDRAPNGFISTFEPFATRMARDGMVNSLAQVTLKMACPGIPDFYQGTELWDWSLVDPDNRRPVDYGLRDRLLSDLEPLCESITDPSIPEKTPDLRAPLRQMALHWEDGKIKLLLTTLGLRYRLAHADLFLKGSYIPLKIAGEMAEHAVAFARDVGEQRLVVVVPRLIARFKLKTRIWDATHLQLPDTWHSSVARHLFTGETCRVTNTAGHLEMGLSDLFATLPVAWLEMR